MRGNGFRHHEPRQPVLGGSKARTGIEITLARQHLFAEFDHAVAGKVQSVGCVHEVQERLECFRLVQDGERDKEAHAERIDGGRGDLEVSRQLDLALGLERIHVSAHLEHVLGNSIPCRMIGTHGAGRVGHADTGHCAGIVGRHGLSFHDRYPLHPEYLSGDRCAIAQDPAEITAFADFVHQVDGRPGIAEPGKSGLHCHTDAGSHLDGIDAVVIVQEIEPGDGIQIVDAAVAAMGPDRFIFGLLGQVMAVLIMVHSGTLDHAAAVAGMGGQSAALGFQRCLGLAADLCCAVEASLLEIIGGIPAHLVQDVGQDVRTVGRQTLSRDRVLAQPLDELLVRFPELLGVLRRARFGARVIQHDHLDVLRAHYSADAPPACVAGRPKLHVRTGNRGGRQLHLPCRTNGHAGDLVAMFLFHLLDEIVVGHHLQAVVRGYLDAVLVDEDLVERVVLGLAFEDDGSIPEPSQDLRGLASGVRFLDPAGERALAAHRDPARHCSSRAAQQAGSDHELVLGTQGMAQGVHLTGDNGGSQCPPAKTCIVTERGLDGLGTARCSDVNAHNPVHRLLLS